jgi:hypothetical protein
MARLNYKQIAMLDEGTGELVGRHLSHPARASRCALDSAPSRLDNRGVSFVLLTTPS